MRETKGKGGQHALRIHRKRNNQLLTRGFSGQELRKAFERTKFERADAFTIVRPETKDQRTVQEEYDRIGQIEEDLKNEGESEESIFRTEDALKDSLRDEVIQKVKGDIEAGEKVVDEGVPLSAYDEYYDQIILHDTGEPPGIKEPLPSENYNLFDQKEAKKDITFAPVAKEKTRTIPPRTLTRMATTGRNRASGWVDRDVDKASALFERTPKDRSPGK